VTAPAADGDAPAVRSIRPSSTTEGPAPSPGSEGPSRLRRGLTFVREGVQLVVVALVLAFVIKSLVMQAFFIPSGSMLQTLQIGDRVLVEKISLRFGEPERGDIIVFRRPGLEQEGFSVAATWRDFLEGIGLSEPDPDRDLIKRVVGLPGETVELVDGVVVIDGRPLDEPYTAVETRSFPPVTIADGEYYVLGDNRGNSLDSRFSLGTIPEDNIIGRAFAIIWPPSQATLDMGFDHDGPPDAPGRRD
jgi:signal peptidase I